MKRRTTAERDRQISESRTGKWLGRAARLGGTALIGLAAYYGSHYLPDGAAMEMGDSNLHPVSLLEAIPIAAGGVAVLGAGMRLGLERGAAVQRVRRDDPEMNSETASTFLSLGTGSELVFAASTGFVAGTYAEIIPVVGGVTMAALGAFVAEIAIEDAGRGDPERQPVLHNALHIGK